MTLSEPHKLLSISRHQYLDPMQGWDVPFVIKGKVITTSSKLSGIIFNYFFS